MQTNKIISKLKYTKDKKRISVFSEIDDKEEYLFSVDPDTLIKYNLAKGSVLNSQTIEQIKFDEFQLLLYHKALEKLTRRHHSRQEIKIYLKKKFYDLRKKINIKTPHNNFDEKNLIEDLLAKLEDKGYMNESEYIKMIIRSKKDKKSMNEIKRYLISKGISYDNIDSELKKNNENNQETLVKKLGDKKMRLLKDKNLTKYELKQKIFRYLAGKGFNFDEINSYLDNLPKDLE